MVRIEGRVKGEMWSIGSGGSVCKKGRIHLVAIVTAATGVKKQSRGQGLFLVSVKRSRTIFKLGNSGQDVYVLCVRIVQSVVKCVRSNGQGPICGVVKQQKQWSKFFYPGRSCDYSTYGSDHPLKVEHRKWRKWV